jgi:hypothetical protein
MTFFHISTGIGNGSGSFGFTVFDVGFDITIGKHGPEVTWWYPGGDKIQSWSWENGYETF